MEHYKRAIALGFFDGVHIGHQKLMECAVQRAREKNARSTVYSFDRHPSELITGRPVPLLVAPVVREQEIRRLGGVDEVIFAHFDQKMREMHWRDFIRTILYEQVGAVHIISGRNHRFGYRGEGTAQGLAEECQRLGIGYDCIEDVKIEGITVSSTYIRSLLEQGEMERAQQYLGRPYTIAGQVEHGRKVGRQLSVPTLNIPFPSEMQQPPFGVYFSLVHVDGQRFLSVTNLGVRPTFLEQSAVFIEPHLLDFTGDLYGKTVQIELLCFRRSEKHFDSPEQLKSAILQDAAAAKQYFARRGIA